MFDRLLKKRGRPSLPPIFYAFALIFCVCYFVTQQSFQILTTRAFTSQSYKHQLISITSDPRNSKESFSSFATLGESRVIVYWPYGTQLRDVPKFGQKVRVEGYTQPLKNSSFTQYLIGQGVSQSVSVSSYEKPSWSSDIFSTLLRFRMRAISELLSSGDDAESGIASAILFGYKSTLSSQPDAFREAGLSHMLSVSGSHFALALVALEVILRSFKLSRKTHLICALLFAIVFVGMTGMAASALRAALMFGIVQLSWFAKRRTSLLATLSLSGIALLVMSPHLSFSLGFQLSYAAVIGIALFMKLFRTLLYSLPWRLPQFFIDNIALSVSATCGTLPLVILSFSMMNPLSFLSSLITTYLFMLLMFLGLAFVVSLPWLSMLSGALLTLIHLISRALLTSIMYLGDIPAMTLSLTSHTTEIALGVLALEIVLFGWYPLPKEHKRQKELRLLRKKDHTTKVILRTCIVAALVVAFVLSPYGFFLRENAQLSQGIYFLDVGQGDATLIKQDGIVCLIDAGPDALSLQNALRRIGVTHIDYLLFTHGHADHIDGAQGLSRSLGIRRIIVAKGCENDAGIRDASLRINAPIETVLAGDSLQAQHLQINVVWPREKVSDPDDNNSCLMVALQKSPASQGTILITGDGEKEAVNQACRLAHLSDLSLLKLGHHGSKNSLDQNLLDHIKIHRIVISVGENSYGHPKAEILQLIKKNRIPFQRTDQTGTIFVPSMAQ